MPRLNSFLVTLCVLAVAAVAFLTGIRWGLPSREADAYLFGDRTPWTGAQILALTGGWGTADRASDQDANPLVRRDRAVIVNDTDAKRAEIVQRYRLYSHQPDEMLTLRALGQMRPDQLDPRMYQYGGLWVYPAGALLKIGSLKNIGLLTLKGDVAYYLDHPEVFAKFYVVLRGYSALWGLAGAVAVMILVRRMTGSEYASVAGGVSFAFLPVVMDMAHEAKPHLAGAVLLLWTVLAAHRYVVQPSRKHVAAVGAWCGAAIGMVLLSLPGVAILVVMVLLVKQSWKRRLRDGLIAAGMCVLVYGITNPFVIVHQFQDSGPLRTNMTAHENFYHVGLSANAVRTGLDLMGEGSTRLVLILGVAFAAGWAVRCFRKKCASNDRTALRDYAILLAAPCILVAIQFFLLAAGQPGEYGRFAILPCIGLLIATIVGTARALHNDAARRLFLAGVGLWIVYGGSVYLVNFVRDTGPHNTRAEAAQILSAMAHSGKSRLAITADPAPYCLPPVDLFQWTLMLQPKGHLPAKGFDALVVAGDNDSLSRQPPDDLVSQSPLRSRQRYPSRINWANKPINILTPKLAQ